MIVIYWKGKVWLWISNLLNILQKKYILMDDWDIDQWILQQADVILVSPWVKQSHMIYELYKEKIKSELNFLWDILPDLGLKNAIWFGITATNWKSTTTWVLYNILKWLLPNRNIWITGNFDVPISQTLANILEKKTQDQEHIFVVECSSFMLYELNNFVFDYSILLNIARDHLDWHKDWDEYRDSKLNLLKHTRKLSVTNKEFYDHVDQETKNHSKIFDRNFDLSKTKFLGKHNQENLSATQAVLQWYFELESLLWDKDKFANVLQNLEPLKHRLNTLREIDWIKIYDDGICTSSQALAAGLDAFDQKLVLIAGWYDKWDDYSWLDKLIKDKVTSCVLIWQIAKKMQDVCNIVGIHCEIEDSLENAIKTAYRLAKQNEVEIILFSPGAASFDMFQNVYDRVDQFEKIIASL